MIRAVIFDMDGVLVESEDLWAEADKQFAKNHGVTVPGELIVTFKGRRQSDIIADYQRELHLQGDVDELMRERIDIVITTFGQKAKLVKGVKKLLDNLRYNIKKPYRLAVASSSPHEVIDFIMDQHDLWDYFELTVSGEDVKNGKPAPDIYLASAKKLDTEPQHCLAIEDSVNGIKSAQAAGMVTIALEKSYVKHEDSAKADHIVKRFSQLTPEYIHAL